MAALEVTLPADGETGFAISRALLSARHPYESALQLIARPNLNDTSVRSNHPRSAPHCNPRGVALGEMCQPGMHAVPRTCTNVVIAEVRPSVTFDVL